MRTFAIGDIHGCRDLLVAILAQINQTSEGEPYRIVCLGDYVDRGPDSAGVVALLRARQAEAGEGGFVCLKGNHEAMLLEARTRRDMARTWLANGGRETLASFGVASAGELPADVLAWFEGLPSTVEDERRCFVHAGLNPGLPRSRQSDEDRLWIRDRFLDSDHDFGRYVVHGHTPIRSGRPDVRRRRVNLDTAAVFGGRLTAAIFSDDQDSPVGFLQAG